MQACHVSMSAMSSRSMDRIQLQSRKHASFGQTVRGFTIRPDNFYLEFPYQDAIIFFEHMYPFHNQELLNKSTWIFFRKSSDSVNFMTEICLSSIL